MSTERKFTEEQIRKFTCSHCNTTFADRKSYWYHTNKMKQCCRNRIDCLKDRAEYERLKELELEKISPSLEELYQYIIRLSRKPDRDITEERCIEFINSLIRKNKTLPGKFIEICYEGKDITNLSLGSIQEFMKLINTTRNVPASLKKTVAFEQDYKCNLCDCMLPPTYHIDHIKPSIIHGWIK